MWEAIDTCPKPVIARVNGHAPRAAVRGWSACADVAVAVDSARFGFTEARLGLIPATISPYVLRKIGPGHARALFVTGRRFGAEEAARIGLVHRVVAAADLDAAVTEVADELLACSPVAIAESKRLVRDATAPLALPDLPVRLAAVRAAPEAQEGLAAFLEKTPTGMGCAIDRLLIANRGEMAVRVIRACRELGIEAAAVHLPGESGDRHVRLADVAAAIPSFLDADAMLAAADELGADAIHPGYGYLAENSGLRRARRRGSGITWVGPPAAAMRAAGDKLAARTAGRGGGGAGGARLCGRRPDRRDPDRRGRPARIPVAGQGRRRRRRARHPTRRRSRRPRGGAGSRRGARPQAGFDDDRVYLERELGAARHVEVQLLADRHGNVIHLGERDCSAQRRHQKIVEEAPSPAVDADLRAELGAAAVAIARAAGYESAGTAEFLLLPDGSWYFLELNARLQVEHPVTELVTGIDLVRAQLAIADGERLEWTQADICTDRPRDRMPALRRGPGGRVRPLDRERCVRFEIPLVAGGAGRCGRRRGRSDVGLRTRPAAREGDRPRRGSRRLHRAHDRGAAPRRSCSESPPTSASCAGC